MIRAQEGWSHGLCVTSRTATGYMASERAIYAKLSKTLWQIEETEKLLNLVVAKRAYNIYL